MNLAALLAPVTPERFFADHMGQRPLHIPAGHGDKRLLDWPGLSALLAIGPHWTDGNLALILNHRPILADFFMDAIDTQAGPVRRADPAKVETFLAMGASLVGNDVDAIAPPLRRVAVALGDAFAALANANVYASFKGVQGFASHYDLHDVFAVQCEGRKTWRLYANRAENPLAPLASGGPEAQAIIDAAKGPCTATIVMNPGDVLYLPRGVYHDALATEGPSLHVTFAVAPLTGMIVPKLLEAAALRDPLLRAYLPDGRAGGEDLPEALAALAGRLADIITSPGFLHQVIDAQRARAPVQAGVRLPVPPPLTSYARTDLPAEIRRSDRGAVLVTRRGQVPLATAFGMADYVLARPAFSAEELAARFSHVPAAERSAFIALLVHERLFERYEPEL
jgi:ribosomal protein L16 Arg81 hydroxylase